MSKQGPHRVLVPRPGRRRGLLPQTTRPLFFNQSFSRVVTRPAGRVRKYFKMSRVESGRIRGCSKYHGSGQECFETHGSGRVGSARVGSNRPQTGTTRKIVPRENPCSLRCWGKFTAGVPTFLFFSEALHLGGALC